jgi:type VI secretion system protein ImpF
MARGNEPSLLRPSLLDRLIEPGGGRGHPAIGLREVRAAVARDLEWLLNTKCVVADDPALAQIPEAQKSLLTYGIPDFSGVSWRSGGQAKRICRDIETAVKTFEPRLVAHTVRVSVVEIAEGTDFSMRFRIEGTLHVEPISEPVSFESEVATDSGAFRIDQEM